MNYIINVTDVSTEALISAYEEHREKIPLGATVLFVCENLDLNKYLDQEINFEFQIEKVEKAKGKK